MLEADTEADAYLQDAPSFGGQIERQKFIFKVYIIMFIMLTCTALQVAGVMFMLEECNYFLILLLTTNLNLDQC